MRASDTDSGGRRGFTLAELLTVIAIIAMVLVFTLPSFQGMSRGTAMTAAVAQLKATLSLARQWAITRRQTTHVVFPDLLPGMAADTPKAYRAYAVVAGSTYVKEWTYLPQGVRFDHESIPTENVFIRASLRKDLPFPTDSGAIKSIPCISFSPDGTFAGGATGCELFLREGWTTVDTNTWSLVEEFRPNTTNRGLAVSYLGSVKFHDYSME